MRGCVTAGMLKAMHELGIDASTFDAVYGASAGACNLTYYLAGQIEGVDVYANNLPDSDFIDVKRFIKTRKGEPLLDISVLLDRIMSVEVPLNWSRVLAHPTAFNVLVASCPSGCTRSLATFDHTRHLREALRVSASPPGVGGLAAPTMAGHTLTDAMVTEPIPVYSALADGCTHVLVLSSAPTTFDSGIAGCVRRFGDVVAQELLMSPTPEVRQAWRRLRRGRLSSAHALGIPDRVFLHHATREPLAWTDTLAAFASWASNANAVSAPHPLAQDRYAYTIAPSQGGQVVGSLCRDADLIRAGVDEGYAQAMRVLAALGS